MTTREKYEARLASIDSRVARLERTNDSWMASHGEANSGITEIINHLMDERDALHNEMIKMGVA